MCFYPFPKIYDPHTNQIVSTNLNDFYQNDKNKNYLNKSVKSMWDKFGPLYKEN